MPRMSLLDHSRATAALVAIAIALFQLTAEAADTAGNDGTASSHLPPKWELGLRAIYAPAPGEDGGFGLGLEGTYYLHPQLGIGAEAMAYVGALGDEYGRQCEYCISNGLWTILFAEGRLFPQFFASPYARLGAGLGWLDQRRERYTPSDYRLTPAFKGEFGVDLHYGMASLRAFVFDTPLLPTAFNDKPIAGYGLQLGVLW